MYFGCHLLENSLETLTACLPQLDDIEEAFKHPTRNSLPGIDTFGRRIFVPRDSISNDSGIAASQLTTAQLNRVEVIWKALKDTEDSSLEDWVTKIAKDLDPEAELQIYERSLEVFNEELAMRSGHNTGWSQAFVGSNNRIVDV